MQKRLELLLVSVAISVLASQAHAQTQPAPTNPPSAPPATLRLDGAATQRPATPTTPTTPAATAATPATAPATLTVQVPASATIWIGEQQMTQTGPSRTFKSPPLDTTKNFIYKLKVTWPQGQGQKPYSTEHDVTVRGGQTTIIDFTPLASGTPPMVGPQQPIPSQPSRLQRLNPIRQTSGPR